MPLKTFTTPETLKMLEYFGWPERTSLRSFPDDTPPHLERHRPGSFEHINCLEDDTALAILEKHMWKIIGGKYDYRHRHFRRTERLNLYDKADECIADFHSLDLDTLLVETGTWIMNREQEKENG